MARGGLQYDGIGEQFATFKLHSSVNAITHEGKAVVLTGNGEVGLGAANAPIFGRLLKYDYDGYGTVQYGGYARLPGISGSLPTPGAVVVGDGAGKVKVSSGAAGRAVAVHTYSDTNEVIVLLG